MTNGLYMNNQALDNSLQNFSFGQVSQLTNQVDPDSFLSGGQYQLNRMFDTNFGQVPQAGLQFDPNVIGGVPQNFNQAVGIQPTNIPLDQYNQSRGWFGELMGGTPMTDASGNIMTNAAGNPVMTQGFTGMDMFNVASAIGQGALGWFMGDRQMDVAEEQLGLKKQAYADTRADQRKLDAAYTGYGRG